MFKSFVAENYWAKKYATAFPVLDLYRSNQKNHPSNKQSFKTEIPSELFQKIVDLTNRSDIGQYIFFYSSLGLLLNKYSLAEDFLVTTSGFNLNDSSDTANNNVLFLRTLFKADEIKVRGFLDECRKTIIEAYKNQEYSYLDFISKYDKISEGESTLFQVALIDSRLHNFPVEVEVKCPLIIYISPTSNSILIECKYDKTYDRDFIASFVCHFVSLCSEMINNLDLNLSQIKLPYLEKETEILNVLNGKENTESKYPSLIHAFKFSVNNHSTEIAVKYKNLSVTYSELDNASNKLVNFLLDKFDLKPQQIVGISLTSSFELVISILAVLKAGATVMPIDISIPAERKLFQLNDSNAALIISETPIEGLPLLDYLSIENLKSIIYSTQTIDEVANCQSGEVAYVIYTSGSTGQPKGVKITHQNILYQFQWFKKYFDFQKDDVLPQKTTTGFVDSIVELLFPITLGESAIYLRPYEEIVQNNDELLDWLISIRTTIIQFVPTVFQELQSHLNVEDIKTLKHLILTGEELKTFYSFKFNIYNIYGNSECTAYSLVHKIDDTVKQKIPIGKAIDNTYVYILDKNQEMLPPFIAGEIFIGGNLVTEGYLNKPELTSEKFIKNPFLPDGLIFKTGDLGRKHPNGEIEYLGRLDDLVKIRGCRIELGEIESAIKGYGGIDLCVVMAKTNKRNEKELVAYITCKDNLDTPKLQNYLSRLLPNYMVPNHYMIIEKFPLTSTGKIDKKGLPDFKNILEIGCKPRNETERKLALIWEEILNKKDISVQDNFFKAGGNSLKVTRLLSKIDKDFGVKLELLQLFDKPLLESQAELIIQSKGGSFTEIPSITLQKCYPLSSSQYRLWILSQFEESSIAYNVSKVYKFEGSLNNDSLLYAFERLIERHEILRTVFKDDDKGIVRQFVNSFEETGFKIFYKDLQGSFNPDELLKIEIHSFLFRSFDLLKGPLLRVGLYQLNENNWVFTFVIHHIISDGWSLEILINEFFLIYNSHKNGEVDNLPPLRIQYKDYSVWQQNELINFKQQADKSYWLKQLEGDLPKLQLMGDRPRPLFKTYTGGVVSTRIDSNLTKKLQSYCLEHNGTLHMVLLTAVNVLLYKYTGQKDIIIGTPIAGRYHSDLENQIGLYVNTLAIRSRFNENNSYEELFDNIKGVTLAAYEHQSYPFDQLVNDLKLEHDMWSCYICVDSKLR
jgi:amino acid adenylation domain-containing protein